MELKMDMLLPLAVDLLQGTVGYQPLNKFLLRSLYGMETYGEREFCFGLWARAEKCVVVQVNHLNQKSRLIWLLDHA